MPRISVWVRLTLSSVSRAAHACQLARGDLTRKVRASSGGIPLQLVGSTVSDRLASVLAQVSRDVHELNRAAAEIRANARRLVEHTSTHSSAACAMVSTLREMSSASARTREATRDLRRLLDGGAAPVRLDDGGPRRSPHALLDRAESSLGDLQSGVARVNRVVLGVESMATDNSMKAQRLWCTAEALSLRAAALQAALEELRVGEVLPSEPVAGCDASARPAP